MEAEIWSAYDHLLILRDRVELNKATGKKFKSSSQDLPMDGTVFPGSMIC
jgi:hypothetical protein